MNELHIHHAKSLINLMILYIDRRLFLFGNSIKNSYIKNTHLRTRTVVSNLYGYFQDPHEV